MRCFPSPDAPPTGSIPPGWSTPDTPSWQPTKYSCAPKPTGGFALLPLEALVLPWLAYEQGVIAPLALRGYLACIEMRERRCGAAPDTPTSYTTEELRRLLGATVRPSTASAVRQALVSGGLLTWSDDGHQVALCPQGPAISWLDHARYTALRAAIHPSVQRVPLPRRLLTWLAAEGAPGLIATVFGVACRALRYRAHRVIAGGSLVPAWVAATFQVARRTVAHWLHRLRALHWLAPIATSPAHRAVHGPWLAINLQWALPAKTPTDKNLATSPCLGRRNRATPRKNLAISPAQYSPEGIEIPCIVTLSDRPHGNPVPETQPTKHHENLCGDSVGIKSKAPSTGDPTAHYAALPPEAQTALYHDAEARLRQHVPTAFLIRPVVLTEVYRLLETPPANPLPTLPLPRQAYDVMSTSHPAASPGTATPPSALPPPRVSLGASAKGPAPPPARGILAQRLLRLADITPPALADVARLRALWQDAQACGWVGGSDADWLTLVTVAQHALRVGDNPGGLFITVLRQRAWHLLTQADEDAARQVLQAARGPLTASERAILRQVFGRHAAGLPGLHVPPLSHAAQCAREALRLCQATRWSGDPFTVVKAAEPSWTRARWEAALAELEQSHLLQQVANAQQQRAQVQAVVSEAEQAVAAESTAAEGGRLPEDGPPGDRG